MFMYSQILKEIILEIQFTEQYFTEFIDYCREISSNNHAELKNIEKFKQNYRTKTAIEWYTSERFLYSALNRGLRNVDTDTIIKMGYFIVDLHQQIEQLHKTQCPAGKTTDHLITVYRGQVIQKIEFEQIKNTSGGLIAFNSFLSTSRQREVSSIFAENDPMDPESVGVLFVITADPAKSSAAFASIKDISHFPEEDEILFVMHAIFRIKNIKPISASCHQFEVELMLTTDTDQDLDVLQKYIQKEIPSSYVGWERLIVILLKMGQTEKAQRINISQDTSANTENKRLKLYFLRGMGHQQRGEYRIAIQYYEKALAIQQQYDRSNHSNLTSYYSHISSAYFHMGDYLKALDFYEKALTIQQQSLRPTDSGLVDSHNNIGAVCFHMGDYSKALVSFEKALAIRQRSLPSNHPDISGSHTIIGLAYCQKSNYFKALEHFEKALTIQQQSLPINHPDLFGSHNNIGLIYFHVGNYSKSLVSFEKALAIQQQSLPCTHPSLATSYNSIGLVYYQMGEYSEALVSYEKALAIQQQSLPATHPRLATSYNHIGNVCSDLSDHSKALEYHEKALAIRQQSLASNHPDIATSYHNIGYVYSHMVEYSKALTFYEKALAIQQQSLPSNHLDLAASYNNIGKVYCHLGSYSNGHRFVKRALEIVELSLSSDHPTV